MNPDKDNSRLPDQDTDKLDPRDLRIEEALDMRFENTAAHAHGSTSDRAHGDIAEEDLQSELKLQSKIEDSIRKSYAPPSAPAALLDELQQAADQLAVEPISQTQTPEATPSTTRRWVSSPWVVATALLICTSSWVLVGFDQAKSMLFGPELTNSYAKRAVIEIYQESVESGFEPDWFCEDEKQFAETFFDRQGHGIWLKPLPLGSNMVGLAYLKGFTPEATCMLAKVDGEPVILFVDKTKLIDFAQLEINRELPYKVHVQELDDLTLVEVSTLEQAHLASYLYLAPPPEEPTGRVPGS